MGFGHAATGSVRCRACRLSLLKTLTGLPGYPLALWSQGARKAHRKSDYQVERGFSTHARERSDHRPMDLRETELNGNVTPHDKPSTQTQRSSGQIPWYLQVPNLSQTSNSLMERQKLPDLPSDSPLILRPLLEHISQDLGLDDLSLLDLRLLDPPPALGANLFMIFGTARSEKHLHVSADRLCRWLRVNYKLSPYADGLLGRNELKLKLRRKARRSKILANVGASEPSSSSDDGIRTGWVCVNAGRVDIEGGQGAAEDVPEGFVGFGGPSKAVRVVIQMFTEEKRAAIDLETLWQGIINRAAKASHTENLAENETNTDQGLLQPDHVLYTVPRNVGRSRRAPTFQQTRTFHSAAGRWRPVNSCSTTIPRLRPVVIGAPVMLFRSASSRTVAEIDSDAASVQRLKDYIAYLKGLASPEALQKLGGRKIKRDFCGQFAALKRQEHWKLELDLYCYGAELGHPSYSKDQILQLLREMAIAGVEPTLEMFLQALEAVLVPDKEGCLPGWSVSPSNLKNGLRILDSMEIAGYGIFSDRVLLAINRAVSPVSIEVGSQQELQPSQFAYQRHLQKFMNAKNVRFQNYESYSKLLQLYAAQGNWQGYWEVWKGMARRMLPRTAELYETTFRNVAMTGSKDFCTETLNTCVPQMERENPKVQLTRCLAVALTDCLKLAKPEVERHAETSLGLLENGGWEALWRRCQRILAEGPETTVL